MLWLAGPVTTELSHRAPDQNPNTKMGFTAGAHGAPDHSRITNCGRFPLRRPSQLRDTSPAAANVTTPTWLAILLSCSSSRTARARVEASILSATALAGPRDFLARAERTHRAGRSPDRNAVEARYAAQSFCVF